MTGAPLGTTDSADVGRREGSMVILQLLTPSMAMETGWKDSWFSGLNTMLSLETRMIPAI